MTFEECFWWANEKIMLWWHNALKFFLAIWWSIGRRTMVMRIRVKRFQCDDWNGQKRFFLWKTIFAFFYENNVAINYTPRERFWILSLANSLEHFYFRMWTSLQYYSDGMPTKKNHFELQPLIFIFWKHNLKHTSHSGYSFEILALTIHSKHFYIVVLM